MEGAIADSGFIYFFSPPGPHCEVPVVCGVFQTTELTDNLFNICGIKKKIPASS